MIAALFVAKNGPYFGVQGIDPWDESRDARKYEGPHRVIAHPPCQRWGRYAKGGPNPKARRFIVGDDAGCFKAAINSVRKWGGVIEHPAGSRAYDVYSLPRPPALGWSSPDEFGGRSCRVDQGNYGHPAAKSTWLYAIVSIYPNLDWSKAKGKTRIDPGFHSKEEAKQTRASADYKPIKRLSERERIHTPKKFQELLISLVEGL